MIKEQEVERWVTAEFENLLPVLVWKNPDGDYEAFGRYRIIRENHGYRVVVNDQAHGFFYTTRSAISWCIADKYKKYNLARDIETLDNMLGNITNDIFVRAGVAHKTRNAALRENIETKLEPKILHKKALQTQLNNCVNWAKYLQQKGFENETSRSGHATTIKTNR